MVPEIKKESEKVEKNSKRRLEKENVEGQHRDQIKKPKKKKPKMNKERRREEKRTTSPANSLSDPSYSDDSEEDWSVCSAKRCQQPEGNEVSSSIIGSAWFCFLIQCIILANIFGFYFCVTLVCMNI